MKYLFEDIGDIDVLEAGRKLDAIVAERVLGVRVGFEVGVSLFSYTANGFEGVAPYSTDIEAAWQVVDELDKRDYYFAMSRDWVMVGGVPTGERGYHARFHPYMEVAYGEDENATSAWAETAPLAICRAALRAVVATQATA